MRSRSFEEMLDRKPEDVIRLAVKGMLPRNKMARKQMLKLKVYAGPDHPRCRTAAQAPGGEQVTWSEDEEREQGNDSEETSEPEAVEPEAETTQEPAAEEPAAEPAAEEPTAEADESAAAELAADAETEEPAAGPRAQC